MDLKLVNVINVNKCVRLWPEKLWRSEGEEKPKFRNRGATLERSRLRSNMLPEQQKEGSGT